MSNTKTMQTFGEIKELISEHRDEAQTEAKECYPCVRSRGAWLTATKDGEVFTEASSYMVTTSKRLKADLEYLKQLGATEIFIDGGFDGADNLQDLNDGGDPYVSEWSFQLV